MAFIKFNNFRGVNTEDDTLAPNILTFGLNTDTQNGRLTKRNGTSALVKIANDKIPKGLHNARFQAGNTLVVGAEDKAYKLTGSEEEIEVTTTAEFEEGTFDDGIVVADNKVSLPNATTYFNPSIDFDVVGNTIDLDIDSENFSLTIDGNGTRRATSPSAPPNSREWIRRIIGYDETGFQVFELYEQLFQNPTARGSSNILKFLGVNQTMANYSPSSGGAVWGFGGSYYNGYANFIFSKNGNNYTFQVVDGAGEFSSTGENATITRTTTRKVTKISFRFFQNAPPSLAQRYGNVTLKASPIIKEWISKVYDIESTPVAASLEYETTIGNHNQLNMFIRASDDGVRFGDWSVVTASGDGIMLKRFFQVRARFLITSVDATSSSLNSFSIKYTNAFDDYEEFDSGLTGNKIRWVNYQGQEKTTTGSITSGSTSLTVADGTGFTIGQTVFVEGAGSAGGYLEATVTNVSGTTITLSAQASATVSGAFVRIDLYQTTYNVYYCDGTNVKKYDGTTVTSIGSVPASRIIYEHKGHMFYVPSVDPTRLYFSEVYGTNLADPLGDFESVPAQNFKQFPSEIKGLRTFEGKLVVSGDNFTAFIVGSIFGGTQDDTVVYIVDNVGVTNHESMGVVVTNQGTILALVTNKGVRYLTGGVYENALQQAPLSESVAFYLKDGSFDNSWLITHENKLYVGYDSGVLPPLFNDSVLVWDFRRGVIDGIWSLKLNDCAVFRNVLYGASSEDGNILELLTGSSDNGEYIHMIAKMRMHMGEVRATAQNFNIKATTDSDIDNSTSAKIYVTLDKTKELDLKKGRWRKSNTILPQYKGQDLMEQVRNIKKRGTFIEVTVDVMSDKLIEFESFELEYEGVRT